MTLPITPFRRDGHLHDLGLEALGTDDLGEADRGAVAAHLAACPACADRAAALRADDAHPLPARMEALPEPANARGWAAWTAPLLLAATALLALVALPRPTVEVSPAPEPDVLRAKGLRFQVEVWADEGARSRRVRDNEAALPSDRLGFRVATQEEGHVLIVGIDDAGQAWLGYPQDSDGRSRPVDPGGAAEDLGAAVRLDGREGLERIVGLRCPTPFTFADLSGALTAAAADTPASTPLPPLRAGCVQSETRVRKERGADLP